MKIGSFVTHHNVPFTHTNEVIGLIREHCPYVDRVTIEIDDGLPSRHYPNAKYCNCLQGIVVRAYYEKPVIGRNIFGERICTSGIKLRIHDQVDGQGIHQFEMSIHGIGRYFSKGARELEIIELRRYGDYFGYQYNTDLQELGWANIGRFFRNFITLRKISLKEQQKVMEAFGITCEVDLINMASKEC